MVSLARPRSLAQVQTDMPQDISYVYSGYAPLSVRIIEQLARPGGEGLRTMEEVLQLLPGSQNLKRQSLPSGLKPKGYHTQSSFVSPHAARVWR